MVHPFDDRTVLRGGAGGADRERRPVIPLTLAEVADAVGGTLADAPDPAVRVTGDVGARLAPVRPGALFVALAGEQVDGHDYAAAAVAAGAVGGAGRAAGRGARGGGAGRRRPRSAALATRGARPGCPAADRRRRHRLQRQDLHQGPARPAARRRSGPTRRAAGVVQQRARPPADRCCARDGRTRYLVLEMGARGARAHRLPDPASPRRGSAWCSTSAARTSASSAAGRRSRRPRASWSRRCRRDGVAVLNADDPLVRGDGAPGPPRRVVTFGDGAPAPTSAPRTSARRARAGRRTGCVTAGAVGAECGCRCTARTRSATRWPPPRSRWSWACRCRRVAAALAPAPAAQPLADGGHRAARRRHRRQRRLQRQPRVDARRAASAAAMARGAGGPGRCSARWPSSATTAADEHRRVGAARRAARRRPARRRRSGRRRRPRRRRPRAGVGRGVRARAGRAGGASRCCAPSCGPGDVVLVKACRAAGLERVALALADARPGGAAR